jgi:glycerol uptake facilitator-like aquaporin
MIQRIQTIYLLVAGLVIAGLFVFPLVHGVYVNGQPETIMVTGVFKDVNGQSTHIETFIPLIIGTALVALMPLAVIFFYKNRRKQINLCYGLMLVIIAFSYWVSQTVKSAIGDATMSMSNYGIGIILLSLSLLLIVIAQKSIQKDDKLVRSADRLR